MHHHLFTLKPHSDVAKFEFEDGVIRHAAAELLANESTIRNLLVDIATERALALNDSIRSPEWEASLLIGSDTIDDISVDRILELTADVASLVHHQPATLIDVSDLETTWVGSATPGAKVSFALRSASGIDTASFAAWMRDALDDAVTKSPGIGCRAIAPIQEAVAGSPNEAILSFWFTDEASLNSAVADQLFNPILGAELVEPGSIRTWSAVEHRLAPNPNAWAMPTGPLMPVREAPDND